MITRNPRSQTKSSARAAFQASAAGVGAGTLLGFLANNLPANNPWKPWLVFLAPSVSFVVAWSARNIQWWFADRQLRFAISRAKSTIEAALNNPQTSAEHKDQVRKELESLELLSVRAELVRVKSLMRDLPPAEQEAQSGTPGGGSADSRFSKTPRLFDGRRRAANKTTFSESSVALKPQRRERASPP